MGFRDSQPKEGYGQKRRGFGAWQGTARTLQGGFRWLLRRSLGICKLLRANGMPFLPWQLTLKFLASREAAQKFTMGFPMKMNTGDPYIWHGTNYQQST